MNPETPFHQAPPDTPAGREFRCPACGELLYSQRSKLCGRCGAVLPPELVLTDAQVAARRQERQWARNLAETLDPTGRAKSPWQECEGQVRTKFSVQDIPALANEMKRLSCASEFKHRSRHTWLYVTGWLLSLPMPVFCVWVMMKSEPLNLWTIIVALLVMACHAWWWFEMWLCAAPICPGCKQNIRYCPAQHCHVCGDPLSHGRCSDCGVDNTWTGVFPHRRKGGWIAFCPGCGVELDTRVNRLIPG